MEEVMDKGRVSYAGERVYIGIDVHRAYFVASCICNGAVVKRCRMAATSEALIGFIEKQFRGAEVKTCYEAGYSGFWLHRSLEAAGISNSVVHAAGVEVAANDRVKTDKRDSLKLAEQLSAGRLSGIRVPSVAEERSRLLTRTREQLMGAKRRVQIQVRMKLHQFGIFPAAIDRPILLKDVEQLLLSIDGELHVAVNYLYEQWKSLAGQVRQIDRALVEQAKNDPLDAIYRSVPGVGPLTARILSTELGDMGQFANEKALFCFTGLTPGEYSSGAKVYRGHISRQGSARLRHVLIEAAWVAIRKDPHMRAVYEKLAARAGKKRAIVAIARKLIGKIRAVLRSKKQYEVNYKQAA